MTARSVPAALLTHFGGQFGAQASLLLKLTPEVGSAVYMTTYSFTLSGFSAPYNNSYLPIFGCSEIVFGAAETSGSADIEISLNSPSPVTSADIIAGVYRGAAFDLAVCNPLDSTQDPYTVFRGTVGTVDFDDDAQSALVQLRDLLDSASVIEIERYGPACLETIGGPRCRLPVLPGTGLTHITERQDSTAYAEGDYIRVFQSGSWDNRNYECTVAGTSAGSAPTFDTVLGNTTVDGTATFTARDAWAREATVTAVDGQNLTVTVTEARAVDDTWFRQGVVVFDGGANADEESIDISAWDNTNKILTLAIPAKYDVAINDKLFLLPGDDKTLTMCATKFSNSLNFVGLPFTSPPSTLSGD